MHALLKSLRSHRLRVVEVAAKWPLAVDGLAGGKCGGDELSMVRYLDRHRDHVDVWLGHQLFVVGVHRTYPEHFAGCPRGFRAVRTECPYLVVALPRFDGQG
jgi:hypothetical protein